MAAPKGNRFWEVRSSHGRKPKFEKPGELWKACVEYFEWVEENPLMELRGTQFQGRYVTEEFPKMRAMTVGSLCIFLDITLETWTQYRKKKGFSDITTRVDEIIKAQKFQGAAADLLNPNIIARDLGLADKNQLTGAGDEPLIPSVIKHVYE